MIRSIVIVLLSMAAVTVNSHQRTPPGVNPNTYQKQLNSNGHPPPVQPEFHQDTKQHFEPTNQQQQYKQQQQQKQQEYEQQQQLQKQQQYDKQLFDQQQQLQQQQQQQQQSHQQPKHRTHAKAEHPAVLHKDMANERE